MQETTVNGVKMPSFATVAEFQAHLRSSNEIPDHVSVDGTAYTLEEYDGEGKTLRYGNRRTGNSLEITTSNRYKTGYSDAEVEEYVSGTYRPDIDYVD